MFWQSLLRLDNLFLVFSGVVVGLLAVVGCLLLLKLPSDCFDQLRGLPFTQAELLGKLMYNVKKIIALANYDPLLHIIADSHIEV